MKKYSFTGVTKAWCGTTLNQIKAEVSFGVVAKGEIGGYIEKENNLEHDGNAWVYGDAMVYGNAMVSGNARVYGHARVYGDAWVYGDARVYGDASIMWISKIGSRNDTTTFFRSKLGIEVSCGCFLGTIEKFADAVEKTHGYNKHGKAYKLAIELAKFRIDTTSELPE